MAACLAHLVGAQGRVLALEKQAKLVERARASIQASVPQLSSTVDVQVCNVMAGGRHLPVVWAVLVGAWLCLVASANEERLNGLVAALCWLLWFLCCTRVCCPDSLLQANAQLLPACVCCVLPVPHTQSCCTCCCHGNTDPPELQGTNCFDAIHIGASLTEVPRALVQLLRPGGRMVLPLGAMHGAAPQVRPVCDTHTGHCSHTLSPDVTLDTSQKHPH